MASVYIHIVKANGKKYVGQCSGDPKERWGSKGHKYKRQRFYNAIKKYGWENIIHNIIAINLTQEEADDLEKFYIERYKTYDEDYGYNKTLGGKEAGDLAKTNEYDHNRKQIVCIELNRLFCSVAEAASFINRDVKTIRNSCNNGHRAGKYHFRYSSDVNYKMNDRFHSYGVKCVETGEKWTSVDNAASSLNVSVSAVKYWCTKKRKPSNGYNYEYYVV